MWFGPQISAPWIVAVVDGAAEMLARAKGTVDSTSGSTAADVERNNWFEQIARKTDCFQVIQMRAKDPETQSRGAAAFKAG